VIEHAVDLELRQDNPAVKARKVIAATRVTHYHRISWVELPELLEAIERFEQQRLAERSSLIAPRLTIERMKTRVRHIVPLSSQARLLFALQRPITPATPIRSFTPPTTAAMETCR
jgi:hypothetical protein